MYKFCQLFNIYERYQDNKPKLDDNSKIVLSTIVKSIFFVEDKRFYDNFYHFFYEEFKLDENFGMNFEVFNDLINKSENYEQYIGLNDYLIFSSEKRYISERYIQIDKNLLSILEHMKPLKHIKNEVPKEEPIFSYVKKGVMDTNEVNDPSSILHYVTKGNNNKEQGELLFKRLQELSDELNEPNEKELYFFDEKKKWLIEDLRSDIAICESRLKEIKDDTLTNDDLHNIKTALNNDDMYLNDYENDTLTVDIWSDTSKGKYYTMEYNMRNKSCFCNCLSYKYSSENCSDFKCKHLRRLDKTLKKVLVKGK